MEGMRDNIKSAIDMIQAQQQEQKLKWSHLKRFARYLRPHWKQFLIATLIMSIYSVTVLPTPYLVKYAIDDAFANKNLKLLFGIVSISVGLGIIGLITSFVNNYLFTRLNQEILITIKSNLFERILKLPMSFFDKSRIGYLMSRINEVNRLGIFFSQSLISLATSGLRFCFCTVIIFFIHWKLAIASIVILPLFYVIAKYYSSGMRATSQNLLESSAAVSKQMQESLSGIDVIKSFAKEGHESSKFKGNLTRLLQRTLVHSIVHSISSELLALMQIIGQAVVLGYGGFEVIRGNLTIGEYLAFTGYLGMLYGPVQLFASTGLILQPASVAVHRVFELMDMVTEDEDENRTQHVTKLNGDIVFKDVSFSYDGQNKALCDLDFHIHPGEKIAFVGPTGAGKTTLLRLILGFYKATEGEILLDSQNIDRMVLSDLRDRIGIVSQNIFLFSDTVRNNIRYSNPQADGKTVVQAVKHAGTSDFIANLPNGYDTIIGERGMTLSGGQIQKIAIARTILKNPDIILFDEATSHMDSDSEKQIQQAIDKIFRNRTCIIIAHRLSSFASADRIYVLDHGRIIQEGRHEELIAKEGLYKKLYSEQIGGQDDLKFSTVCTGG